MTDVKRKTVYVLIALTFLTLAVFRQVATHDFINYDDDLYVYENSQVQRGLSWEGVRWSFASFQVSNWHPLTWLSHMLDVELFGLDPGPHHLTSLLFHILSAGMIFHILLRATGAFWRSACVAALFAVHPLQVESVAWVAERKDVLSTFFWTLSVASYLWYVRNGGILRYLFTALFFLLGLMAKPMVVTLPFVLLLLDFWPLERWKALPARQQGEMQPASAGALLVLEKLPLLLLSGVSSAVTFLAQESGGAVASLQAIPFAQRAGNALVSYVRYLVKAIWPADLAIFYPFQGAPPLWQIAGSAVLLAILTLATLLLVRRRPYLLTGWLWFAGMLVPVIGLVQVGDQAGADRYTYLPLVGLGIMSVWGLHDLAARWTRRGLVPGLVAVGLLLACAVVSHFQVGRWQNSRTLFEHALAVTKNNHVAHSNLGYALYLEGSHGEAEKHFAEALHIRPGFPVAHNNMGVIRKEEGDNVAAEAHFREAIRSNPEYFRAHNNLGMTLAAGGRPAEAVRHYREALRLNPDFVEAHYNLANVLAATKREEEAVRNYREALRLKPELADGHYNMARTLAVLGRTEESLFHYRRSLQLQPDSADALNNVAWVLATHPDAGIRKGREALAMATRACELTDFAEPLFLDTLAAAYAETGAFDKALGVLRQALEIAESTGSGGIVEEMEERLEYYRKKEPYRDPPRQGFD